MIKVLQSAGLDQEQLEKVQHALEKGMNTQNCIVWTKPKPNSFSSENALAPQVLPPLPEQPIFVDRLTPDSRPGKNELHNAGYYYCMDYSSVLMTLPLSLIANQPIEVAWDMCAAPGGKSILINQWLKPQTLVANEVVHNRIGALISNLKRCEIKSKVVSKDPKIWAEYVSQTCDLVFVDAPCSGQSLLVKGDSSPGCFHFANINKCLTRQRRIIAESSKLVAPQGHLLYSTCTYSVEENEEIVDWFLKKFPHFESIEVPALKKYQSTNTQAHAYRFWPSEEVGVGGFTSFFKNKDDQSKNALELSESVVRWQFPNLN